MPWEKYYEFLFNTFSRFIIQIAPNMLKYNFKELNFPWLMLPRPFVIISGILVHFIVPSDHKNYETLWFYIEKLFNFLQVYVHPQNQGNYTQDVLQFLASFCLKYVYRNTHEIKLKRQIARDLENTKASDKPTEEESIQELEKDKEEKSDRQFVSGQDEDQLEEQNDYEDNIDIEDEEDSDQQPESDKIGVQSAKQVILDEACHDRFLKLMQGYLKYIIFLKEGKQTQVSQICKHLAIFRPQKVIPQLLELIYSSFDKEDISYQTIIKILTVIVTQIIDRRFYKAGLYEIPKIMQKTMVLIQASDFESTCRIWKVYDRIF